MTWRAGDLHCDTCPTMFRYDGPRVIVLGAARAKGWFAFRGRLLGGKDVESHICPECMGTRRSKLPPPPPKLEEDQPLF